MDECRQRPLSPSTTAASAPAPSYSLLQVERNVAERTCTITFQRASALNALNDATYDELSDALDAASADASVLVLIITGGSARYFSAGQDLRDVRALDDILARPVARFMRTLIAFPKPVIAAVNGPAVGIGVTMLLHCDAVYAVRGAHFRLPFLDVGIVPEFCSSTRLQSDACGGSRTRATEMLMMQRAAHAHELAVRSDAGGGGSLIGAVYDTQHAMWEAIAERVRDMTRAPMAERALPQYKRMMMGGDKGVQRRVQLLEEELLQTEERWGRGDMRDAMAQMQPRHASKL